MRRVNYKVRRGNETFVTTSYTEATADDARIVEIFLTEVDERTEKEKEYAKARVRKIAERQEFKKELEHAPSYVNTSGVGAT